MPSDALPSLPTSGRTTTSRAATLLRATSTNAAVVTTTSRSWLAIACCQRLRRARSRRPAVAPACGGRAPKRDRLPGGQHDHRFAVMDMGRRMGARRRFGVVGGLRKAFPLRAAGACRAAPPASRRASSARFYTRVDDRHRRAAQELRAGRARRIGVGRRSAAAVRALARAGDRRAAARAERDDAGDRRRRRPAVDAHRPDQGLRRARHRLVHQLREPQGPRAGRPSLSPRCSSTGSSSSASCASRARSRRSSDAESDAYFAIAPARFAHRRLGLAAEPGDRVARGARRQRGEATARSSCCKPPRPPHWGGYRLRARRVGVLAGPQVAPARPPALPARRRGLACASGSRPSDVDAASQRHGSRPTIAPAPRAVAFAESPDS